MNHSKEQGPQYSNNTQYTSHKHISLTKLQHGTPFPSNIVTQAQHLPFPNFYGDIEIKSKMTAIFASKKKFIIIQHTWGRGREQCTVSADYTNTA